MNSIFIRIGSKPAYLSVGFCVAVRLQWAMREASECMTVMIQIPALFMSSTIAKEGNPAAQYKFMKNIFFLYGVIMILLLTACSSDNDDAPGQVITPNKNGDVEFSASGGSQKLILDSNDFTIENVDEVDWCIPQLNGNELIFTTTENFASQARSAIYRLSGQGSTRNISVVQQPKASVSLKTNIPTIDKKGGTINVQVKSNVKFEVLVPSEAQSWINCKSSRSNELSFTISPNKSKHGRSTKIVLRNFLSEAIYAFGLTQKGDQPLNVIYYTTNDNGKVLPSGNANAFGHGFSILSNTYFDGEGTIVFDGDITAVNDAFHNCSNLETISLPEGITEIINSAFSGCNNLKEIILPSKITTLGFNVFNGCKSLRNIALNDRITIMDGAFANSGLEEIRLPNHMKSLYSNTFSGCVNLKNVYIDGDELEYVGENCFYNCISLEHLNFPKSTTTFGQACFYNVNCDLSLYLTDQNSFGNDKYKVNPFYGFGGYLIVPEDNGKSDKLINILQYFTGKGFKGVHATPDNRCLIVDGILYAANLEKYDKNSYIFPFGIKKIETYAIYREWPASGSGKFGLYRFYFQDGLEETAGSILRMQNKYRYTEFSMFFIFPPTLKLLGHSSLDESDSKYLCKSWTGRRYFFATSIPPVREVEFEIDNTIPLEINVPYGCLETYQQAWPEYSEYMKESTIDDWIFYGE